MSQAQWVKNRYRGNIDYARPWYVYNVGVQSQEMPLSFYIICRNSIHHAAFLEATYKGIYIHGEYAMLVAWNYAGCPYIHGMVRIYMCPKVMFSAAPFRL